MVCSCCTHHSGHHCYLCKIPDSDNCVNVLTCLSGAAQEAEDSEVSMISDTASSLWIRDKTGTGSGLEKGGSRSSGCHAAKESQASSWTPLLHNLSTESIL